LGVSFKLQLKEEKGGVECIVMTKRHTFFGLSIVLVLFALASTRCGSGSGVEGGSGGVSVNLVIQNPDPNASGSAKAIPIDSSKVLQSKTLTSSDINTCTLTVSASDMTTVTSTFTVASGVSTVTTSVDVPAGSGRTFAIDCSDTSGTTNDITVGYNGSTSADVAASGSNTIALSPQFKNLVADDSTGTQFMRLNQENSTQTKLTIGFGSALTDAQKIALRCIVEFDISGIRTSLGVIDSNQSDGLTTSTKSGSYLLVTGGSNKPSASLYNSSDTRTMRLTSAWGTTDTGNTQLTATFGIKQMKSIVDSNEGGPALAP